ncbi:hypothetical protein ABB37_04103 [Leptomonas pyrrhocoris]|uniref:Transmembrane protein n=1 Tax=Leptomonas pyrrhocoris TaxID=157538 RepID=A0A0M9G4C3_LEPPY|nr:hypothetical protein ABB37_04103 [Leptomonas pyrrhocoris]XP_015660285.1 hypothetical protein ABB37_04103 [Leptomonas pyrrhocoris]KPA81845.1 hypothetical protein ABB37_04103 [Leptomonas pyrrhocoris]KPA81846.1 hypothetical protein ABB37_04103 [Leptomonas pyrrhocoris]|eukprot:XP_015660284.1 hypothetical protein ABB37_04103 [Leptomonas pyrrhocoris]
MQSNMQRMEPETLQSFVRRSCISTFLFCIIYSTGMIQECISAKHTNNLFLYPSLFCIAAFFTMWGVTAYFMIPKDPMWYRHHEGYILVASILICFGPCMLIVAIYPIYHMWSCAIVFIWVCLIGNVNGALTYLQDSIRKKKLV